MALNYTQHPMYPAHISEDNLVSPMRIVNGYLVEEGVPEKNGEGYLRSRHTSRGETEERDFCCGRNRFDCCSSSESTSKDIVDLLPSDPFGMDIETTFTAITGWLEDLEADYGGYVNRNSSGSSQEDYGLFAGWNLIWNNALKFQSFPNNVQFSDKFDMRIQSFPSNRCVNEKLHLGINSFPSIVLSDEKVNVSNEMNQYGEERDLGDVSIPFDYGFQSACNMGDIAGRCDESPSNSSELFSGEKVEGAPAPNCGVPHEALAFALSYLGLKDLLSVERVCRPLCSTIRGDPLLWMNIHIDQPLNERITDDILVQLASRAQGNLQSLTAVECPRVTDDGLRRVLKKNPRLTKLCVPGCTRLSVEGIVYNLKVYNSNKDVMGIKHLRIGGLYGVTHEHFKELKFLLGADCHKPDSYHKQHFYHRGNFYLPSDDDRAIDIEMCPICEKFRLVYDCPAEGCQVKDKSARGCRACTLCIARCAQCGRCINDTEYEETFCLELLCSDCFKQLLKYQDKLDKKVEPTGTLQETSYNFSLHG